MRSKEMMSLPDFISIAPVGVYFSGERMSQFKKCFVKHAVIDGKMNWIVPTEIKMAFIADCSNDLIVCEIKKDTLIVPEDRHIGPAVGKGGTHVKMLCTILQLPIRLQVSHSGKLVYQPIPKDVDFKR